MRSFFVALVVLSASSSLVACTHHVKAYQRGALADPRMSVRDASGPAESHVYSVQEGATGGGDAAASGCGCN